MGEAGFTTMENVRFKGAWGSEYLYALLRHEWLSRRDAWRWRQNVRARPF
jgi:hypothetical protein